MFDVFHREDEVEVLIGDFDNAMDELNASSLQEIHFGSDMGNVNGVEWLNIRDMAGERGFQCRAVVC